MEKVFEGRTEQEIKLLIPIYEKLLAKGLSEEEAKEKALKELKKKQKIGIFILLAFIGLIISLVMPSKPKLYKEVSSLTPFRQTENALQIFENFYNTRRYESTSVTEPNVKVIGDIEYDTKYTVAYFRKAFVAENGKLNLNFLSRIAFEEGKVCIFNITLQNIRPEDNTKAMFKYLRADLAKVEDAFSASDHKEIMNATYEAEKELTPFSKINENMSIEVTTLTNEISITVSMEGN